MRLGWGRDDGPFFFSCPGRKPHERCEPGPILLCMGLFSRFCVWAPRCTAHSVSKTRVNALMRRCVRDTRSHHALAARKTWMAYFYEAAFAAARPAFLPENRQP